MSLKNSSRDLEHWFRMRPLTGFLFVSEQLGDNITPVVFLIEDADGMAGIVMGRISVRRTLCRVGYLRIPTPKLKTLDIVYGGMCTKEDEDIPNLVDELLTYARGNQIRQLNFNHLSTEIGDLLPVGKSYEKPSRHWAMIFNGDSSDEIIDSCPKKLRQNIRRWKRKLNAETNGEIEMRVFSSMDLLDEFIEIAGNIAGATYHASVNAHISGTDITSKLWKQEALKNRFIGFVLLCNGEPVAFRAGIIYRTTLYAYGTAYLPAWRSFSPGMFLLFESIKELSKRGVEQIDFGFGDAEYKSNVANNFWYEASYQIYAYTPLSLVARGMVSLTSFASTVLDKFAHRLGAWQSIRRKWRDRLARKGA